METPLQEAHPSYSSHRQRDAYGRTDPKYQHLQQSKPEAPKAETLGAHQHSRLRSVCSTTNQSTPMCNRWPAGSAVEALETDGTTTGAEDLTWRTQHNAINP
jgi:hypothetical protein